jgi:hypothetical protein
MTREDIIRMAREAELNVGPAGMGQTVWGSDTNLKRFAALVAAAEREECAKLADEYIEGCEGTNFGVGKAIRARGQA